MDDWQAGPRLQAVKLLAVLILNADSGVTQYAEKVLTALCLAAGDKEASVVKQVGWEVGYLSCIPVFAFSFVMLYLSLVVGTARMLPPYNLWIITGDQKRWSERSGKPFLCILYYRDNTQREKEKKCLPES